MSTHAPLVTLETVSNNARAIVALSGAYLLGLAATVAVLFSAQLHFVAFDSSDLLFAHYRLPQAHELALALGAASLAWFAIFVTVVVLFLRKNVVANGQRIGLLVAGQFLLGCAFTLMPIAVDSDQYAYAEYAYVASHGNPYSPGRLPMSAPSSDRQIALHWGNPPPPDAYGGAWTAFNAWLLAPFENASVRVQVLALRFAALIAACLTTLLIAASSRNKFAVAVAFALNPLVFLEVANGAHNDIFLVLGGCAAAWAALRHRFTVAAILVALASAVKFSYAPLIAPLLAFAYRRAPSLENIVMPAAAFVATIALFTVPFGWRHGPLSAVFGLVEHSKGTFARLTPLASIALVAALAALTVEAARGYLSSRLLIVAALLMLALPGKIEPWYPLMTAPLLIIPLKSAQTAFLGFSALGMVLVQASFLGEFPLVEGFAAALATVCVCVAVFTTNNVRKAIT
ncbi:MAG: hypothetical protein JO322_05120 [Candidatus Eremiobacteraeota bacterium]|nr:hypothetical protein [Candidatus Eremiobacteraeota bacterium]